MTFAFFNLLFSCANPGSSEGTTAPTLLPAEEIATVDLAAVIPTDVLARPDGSFLVLDGYGGKLWRVASDGQSGATTLATNLPRAIRLSPASDGGFWATVPGMAEERGQLVHLTAEGNVDGAVLPESADGTALHPVDVVETNDSLVIADRFGSMAWIDKASGKATKSLTADGAEREIRRGVDLELGRGDGELLLVDALRPSIIRIDSAGKPGKGFGRQGLHVSAMARPTSVQAADGGVWVVDSVLGVVQAFEDDGDFIGALAQGGKLTRFTHPMAVRSSSTDPSVLAVLETTPAKLHLLKVAPKLPAAQPPTLVRYELVASQADPSGDDGDNCLQCHDGLVNDDREGWDPARKHHPRDIVPKMEIPKLFPLDDAGKLVCSTCHSPHGVVADTAGSDAALLVRHRSDESPFTRISKDGDAFCLACHVSDQHVSSGVAAVDASKTGHPTGAGLTAALEARAKSGTADPSEPTKASCMSCHSMHGATGEHILRDPGDGKACLGCHTAKSDTTRNHVLGRVPGKDLSAAAKAGRVVLSTDGGVGCLSCHDLTGDRSITLLRTLPAGRAICLDCHADRTDINGGPHSRLSKNGKPTCINCHDIHGGDRKNTFLTLGPGSDGDPKGCLSCHGPGGRGARAGVSPGKAGHPVDGRDIADKTGKAGATLTCLACHDPHAADKPRSKDCQTCHAEQGKLAEAGGHGVATCLDCHPAHNKPAMANTADNPATQRCLACHAPGTKNPDAPKLAEWTHPAPMFLPDGTRWTPLAGLTLFDKSGKAMPAGQNGEMSCQTCHAVHGPDTGGGPHLRKAAPWKEACGACHGDDTLVYYQYFHKPDRRTDLSEKKE